MPTEENGTAKNYEKKFFRRTCYFIYKYSNKNITLYNESLLTTTEQIK